MKRTFLLLTSIMLLSMISCKKSSVPNTNNEQEKSTSSSSEIILPQFLPLWFKIADIPDDRTKAFGFSIGSHGYVGGGWGDAPYPFNSLSDLWMYDTTFKLWVKRASLPGYTTQSTAAFVAGGKGYIATGKHSYTGPDTSLFDRLLKDTWEYDPAADQWTKKADFPGGEREGAVGIGINGKGYVGLGSGLLHLWGTTIPVMFSDWWEYDPATNKWTQKKSFPGGAREVAVGCAAGTFGYVGTGVNKAGNLTNDWWQYDAAADSWTQKASLPGPARSSAVAFSSIDLAGPKAYVSTGYNNIVNPNSPWLKDLWRYDPATNQWVQSFNLPYGRSEAACFVVNNIVYLGSGEDDFHIDPVGGPFSSKFWGFHL
jgi:N-acetylneuraminic acid mutarotase